MNSWQVNITGLLAQTLRLLEAAATDVLGLTVYQTGCWVLTPKRQSRDQTLSSLGSLIINMNVTCVPCQ